MKNFESILAAYLIGWAIFFVYYLTVARRLARVEEELRRLQETLERRP
jgi:CcmD family protein